MESGPDPFDTDTLLDVACFTTVSSSSPSCSNEGSAPSSPVSVMSSSPVPDSSSPGSVGSTSPVKVRSPSPIPESSSPDTARSGSSSPVVPASPITDMSPSSSSPDSESEPVTPPPDPNHSYALSSQESKTPRIPPELTALKVAKKLEDNSLPSIDDVLRHTVHLRQTSSEANSRFTVKDVSRQAAEDIIEIWGKLSSKLSGDVIMDKNNIRTKVSNLMDRYKNLTTNSSATTKKSQLDKMSVEVGRLFDILSCKR